MPAGICGWLALLVADPKLGPTAQLPTPHFSLGCRTESRKHKSSSRHRSEREDTGSKREAADDGPSRREERQAPAAAPVTDKVKDTKPDSKSSRGKRSSSHRS